MAHQSPSAGSFVFDPSFSILPNLLNSSTPFELPTRLLLYLCTCLLYILVVHVPHMLVLALRYTILGEFLFSLINLTCS